MLHIATDDVLALRHKLEQVFALQPAQRQSIGISLRQNVIEQHSLNQLIQRLICVMHTGEIGA